MVFLPRNDLMKRFKLIISVYLILIRNNKVLLLRRRNTGYEDGKYGLPSGHLEDNESITNALKREVKEEIGIDINIDDLRLAHAMHRREKDIRVDFFFTCKKYKGTPSNTEPEKCDDLNWFPVDKLPTNTVSYVRKAILSSLNKVIYSEIGW